MENEFLMVFYLLFCSRYFLILFLFFFFSSRRRHTRSLRDWSSDVCSSDLLVGTLRRAGQRSCQAFHGFRRLRQTPRRPRHRRLPRTRADARRRRHHRSQGDRKSTRLNSSHVEISYAVFCLKKKKKKKKQTHNTISDNTHNINETIPSTKSMPLNTSLL